MAFNITRIIGRGALAGAVALLLLPAGAAAATRAGVSAAVRGDVQHTSVLDAQTRPARSGEDVYLGDRVRTAVRSGMQLMLLDESTFTVGPEANLTIDRYVYDPARGAGEISASLTRGALRFVSGRISRETPENVNINVPVGTIGVRGTIVTILPSDEGFYVILGGPTAHNVGLARRGRIIVTAGGRSVTLKRFGIGVLLRHDGTMEGPFRVPLDQRGHAPATLTPAAVSGEGTLPLDASRLAEIGRLLDLIPDHLVIGPLGPLQPGEITDLIPDLPFAEEILQDGQGEFLGRFDQGSLIDAVASP